MAESKQDEGFKVVDRRLFTESGELRKEAVERERQEEETAAAKSALKPGDKSSLVDSPTESAVAANSIAPSRNFQMLVDFLTRNAAAMLGGMADPRTGQPFVDVEGAREMIDMLDVLREKTMGNLAKVDEDLMLEVIGSLKLTFMEISKAAAEAMAKKTAGKK